MSSGNCHHYLQAWFSGKKIGHGFGRTRMEAQYKAAEDSIKHLAGRTLQFLEVCVLLQQYTGLLEYKKNILYISYDYFFKLVSLQITFHIT